MENKQQASDRRDPTKHDRLSRWHLAILWQLATATGDEEQGTAPQSRFGSSVIHEYQISDAADHVVRDARARADRPYIRDSYDDQKLDVWLLIDLGVSIKCGVADYLKRDRAIEFAAEVGQLFSQQGNQVGALLFVEHALRFV